MISSSDAPIAARPISCENCAKFGSAKSGTWPNNSWQQSLLIEWIDFELKIQFETYGSGVYAGFDECRMYCVQWKTRNARPYKKSLGER